MNIEEQIINTFGEVVDQNYHHLASGDLFNKPPITALSLILDRVSGSKEKPYRGNVIEFQTPQLALSKMTRGEPVTYMDKLMVLAAFARCLNFEHTIAQVEYQRRPVTFLQITKIGDPNESYYMCPGRPFNKLP